MRARLRAKFLKPCPREKPLGRWSVPVPKPTQVGRERIPRRSEEPSLRNSAKWPRNFGRRGASLGCKPLRPKPEEAAVERPKRLFTKNKGLCEVERRRIGADACPVPEGHEERLVFGRSLESKPR